MQSRKAVLPANVLTHQAGAGALLVGLDAAGSAATVAACAGPAPVIGCTAPGSTQPAPWPRPIDATSQPSAPLDWPPAGVLG